jgi:hypothetical protein
MTDFQKFSLSFHKSCHKPIMLILLIFVFISAEAGDGWRHILPGRDGYSAGLSANATSH